MHANRLAAARAALLSAALAFAPAGADAATFGFEQSPIDIITRDAVRAALPPVVFDYAAEADLRLVDNGSPDEESNVIAFVDAGAGALTLGGVRFELLQFHLHSEAEHLIDGKRAALELHLVHRSAGGALAVVARFLEEGEENPALAPFFDGLAAAAGGTADVAGFMLSSLVAGDLLSYRYPGSLTTPGFDEGVSWVVLAEPMTASLRQIEEFKALFPEGNAREPQPLFGRTVLTDVAPVPLPPSVALLITALAFGAGFRRRPRAA